MKKPALLFCMLLLLLSLPAQAAMIVNDHFDDGVLAPAWNATPRDNAKAWTYQESGTNLTVTDIEPTNAPVPSGVMANWAIYQLSRSFDPISNFHLDFDISWNEGSGGNSAMQRVAVQLGDGQGNKIAWAGYYDNWNTMHGSRAARGYPTDQSVQDWAIPPNGSASIDIIRTNGELSIFWNDSLFLSTFNDILVGEIFINFGYYPLSGATFGSLSVDQVKLESSDLSAAPEPATLVLLGSALGLGGWWQRRRKRNKHIQA